MPKEKSESDLHGVSEKEKKLLLMESTNFYDEKTGRTGALNRQCLTLEAEPEFVKVKPTNKNRV